MENPFETGHIKNYMMLYASVVLIVILFFLASTLFMDVKKVDKKVFETTLKEKLQVENIDTSESDKESEEAKSKFKIMEKSY